MSLSPCKVIFTSFIWHQREQTQQIFFSSFLAFPDVKPRQSWGLRMSEYANSDISQSQWTRSSVCVCVFSSHSLASLDRTGQDRPRSSVWAVGDADSAVVKLWQWWVVSLKHSSWPAAGLESSLWGGEEEKNRQGSWLGWMLRLGKQQSLQSTHTRTLPWSALVECSDRFWFFLLPRFLTPSVCYYSMTAAM